MTTYLAPGLIALAAALFVGTPVNPLSTRLKTSGMGGTAELVPARLADVFERGRARVLRRLRKRRDSADRSDAVSEGCLIIAAELAAGRPPPLALRAAADAWPELFALPAGQAGIGRSAGAALRQAATVRGADSLVAVAAAWEVSERTGASLADVLTSVADCLRDEAAIRREAAAQLATVRATARLMAVLPLATLGVFSAGNGGKPLAFLLTSVPGLGCLAGAVVFVALGLAWVERTAHQATRSAWSP